MTMAKRDPIQQLQAEAAFGRAVLAAVKESGLARSKRRVSKNGRKKRSSKKAVAKPAPEKKVAAPKAKVEKSKRGAALASVPD